MNERENQEEERLVIPAVGISSSMSDCKRLGERETLEGAEGVE